MKKYLKLLFVALFATMSFSLVSCGDDDNDEPAASSELVGTWDLTKETTVFMGESDVEYPKNVYWVFTNNKLVVHDVNDMANGKEISYKYDIKTKQLQIVGFPLYTITKLTDSSLVMTSDALGMQTTLEFKKRK